MASFARQSAPSSRQNTPARAITSTLSARSAPVAPPASQTYEPHARAVLRRRLLYDILLPSTLPVWAAVTFWTLRSQGGPSALGFGNAFIVPFTPATLTFSVLTWALGVLPVVVLRKSDFTATPTSSSSPSQMLRTAYSKPNTFRALIVYISTSAFTTVLHIFHTYTKDNTSFSVFVKSRKHPYYLNGQFLFLCFAQVAFAFAFHFRNVLLDRFVVHWTRKRGPKMDTTGWYIRWAFSWTLATSLLSISAFTIYLAIFGLLRSLILPVIFKTPILRGILRPFLAHFLRGPWTITLLPRYLPLTWHTFLLGVSTVGCWEFAEELFDEKVQQPLTVALHTADPAVTLVSGISSSDLYFKHFAYEELCDFSKDESAAGSARRTALFGDQKYNPPLWSLLVRESLLFLGNDYQLLLRRGKPAPPPAVAPQARPKSKGPETPTIPLIRKAIFKTQSNSPINTVLDSFASDGVVTRAVEASTETSAAHIPELFQAIDSPIAKANAEVAQTTSQVAPIVTAPARRAGFVKRALGAYVPPGASTVAGSLTDWWQRERVNKLVECVLPHREIDALVIEVLTRLVCTSLTEDRFGIVQRDIPRILEALLTFLSAAEEYQEELTQRAPPAFPDESELSLAEQQVRARAREEVARAGEVLSVVVDASKEGVIRVVRTFGGKLTAFRFPPHIARKLQGFVDYA